MQQEDISFLPSFLLYSLQTLRPTQAAVQLDQDIAAQISANGAADYKSYDMSKVRITWRTDIKEYLLCYPTAHHFLPFPLFTHSFLIYSHRLSSELFSEVALVAVYTHLPRNVQNPQCPSEPITASSTSPSPIASTLA
jgi:hypothetical protein